MSVLEFADQLHRYSIDEYEQLMLTDAFADQRVELIDGLILDMSPKSPRHENVIAGLNRWFSKRVDDSRFELRIASPLRIGGSEPEPDLSIVDLYRPHEVHPESAHLVIEVALSSRARDLTLKPSLYAPAVAEYWVVDLEGGAVVVHRQPAVGVYRTVTVHGREDTLAPRQLSIKPLPLGPLLAAA